jgi:hypothetical protein
MVKRFLNEKLDSIELYVLDVNETVEDESFLVDDNGQRDRASSSTLILCRNFKDLTRNLKERALRVLSFVRLISFSLESCSAYLWTLTSVGDNYCDQLVEALISSDYSIVFFVIQLSNKQ